MKKLKAIIIILILLGAVIKTTYREYVDVYNYSNSEISFEEYKKENPFYQMLNPFKIDYAELLFSSDIYIASIIVAIILLFNFENKKDETVGQFLVDSQASNRKEIKTKK